MATDLQEGVPLGSVEMRQAGSWYCSVSQFCTFVVSWDENCGVVITCYNCNIVHGIWGEKQEILAGGREVEVNSFLMF